MVHILRLVTCDGTDSAATDREMDTEVEEEYSDDDDLSMLGPDAGRWWNYSEKGTGDDYSLEDINQDNDYGNPIASLTDESVVKEKLPTNFWKPLIPSRDLVSVTLSPFSWLPSVDIPQTVQIRNEQTYVHHSFSDDWDIVEHSKDAEETDILVAVADYNPTVEDTIE